MEEKANRILKTIKSCSNLKGTVIKELKEAVASIQEEADILREATVNEEVKRLEASNKKLRREMEELTRTVAEIKKSVRTKGALPGETPVRKGQKPRRGGSGSQGDGEPTGKRH